VHLLARGSSKLAVVRYSLSWLRLWKKQHTWTSSGSWPQACKHIRMAPTNHCVDQNTFSEHFSTIAFPAKREAIMGDQALCRADKSVSLPHSMQNMKRTVIP
jgi:hypothetical protein